MGSKLEDSWEDGEVVHPPPLVVVLGAEEGPYWCQGTPPQVNVTVWGTPSGPSTASCTTNSRSPSLNSFCSDVSWGDGGNDLASLFKPRVNRSRHASTELLSCNRGLMAAAPERLCASHDHLDTGKGKGRHRSRQDKAEMGSRERSSSNVENGRRDTTPDSKVKRFLSKMRSYSHHDLLHGRGRSASCTDAVKAEESLAPEPEEVPEVPATAINARLVGRFRKNGPDLKKRRWSAWEDRMLRLWGSKTHGDEGHVESRTDPEPADPAPAPPPTPATLDTPSLGQAHPGKPRLARTRSNSESAIIIHEKKRKRGFHPRDSRLMDILLDFHHRKKRGSLPSLVANKQHPPSAEPLQKEDQLVTRNGRALSCHNLTDFAVEDYFGENTQGGLSEDELDGDRPRHALHPLDAHGHSRHSRSRFSIDNFLNVLRGKSRSVDHSIHSPFDLDVLRKKIGERTASEPSRDTRSPSPEPVEGSKENIAPPEKKMVAKTQPPVPTMTYTVTASDTLTSIAARFDTTPSELTKLNKLLTRFVYPGQVIAVPDKATVTLDNKPGSQDPPDDTGGGHDPLTHIRPPSPNQRVDLRSPASPHTCPRTPANSMETEKSLDKECLEKFLKISVRHITDGQGVVAGVLLVTPNAVMFDPNVSDPLVIEHGPESYGVIAPMEFVVNAALYYDIAHMRVKDTNLPKPEIPKPEIYWGPAGQVERMGSQESPGKDASLSKDTTFPELAASQDDNDSSCSCGGDTRETSAFPKAFEQELLSPIGSDTSPASGEGQLPSGQPSPAQQQPVVGDLTPIAEATQASGPILAQTVCDNKAAQDLAQSDTPAPIISDDPLTNEKKRTTSVTFDLSGEGEEASPDTTSENNLQETRKQKVLKRLSYPLSWMESFSTEKENMPHPAGVQPSSAPPVGPHPPAEGPEGAKPGVFSNVFSMSNVSNMLSSSPKYLVDFSSGLFARSPSDSSSSVRDVTELGTPPGSLEGYRVAQSVFYRKQSSLGNDKEERKGIPIFHPG